MIMSILDAGISRLVLSMCKIEKANPHARVIRIENADHYIYESNEADVVSEIESFASQLK